MPKPENIEGVGDPEFTAPDEEEILKGYDTDFNPIEDDKKEVAKDEPKRSFQEEHLRQPDTEKPAPVAEERPSEEILDESEVLKKYGLDGFETVDAAFEAWQAERAKQQRYFELIKEQGYQLSDTPMDDMIRGMQEELARKKTPWLIGERPTPETEKKKEERPAEEPVHKPGPGEATYKFLNHPEYSKLNWNPQFLADLAGALGEHIQRPKEVETDGFATSDELQGLVDLNKRMFRTMAIAEYMAERAASGEKLPAGFRGKVAEQIQRNPLAADRALISFATGGSYNGFIDEYVKGLGPLPKEVNDFAAEQEKLQRQKEALKGSSPAPAKSGTKEPSLSDLEAELESFNKLL